MFMKGKLELETGFTKGGGMRKDAEVGVPGHDCMESEGSLAERIMWAVGDHTAAPALLALP